MNHFIKGCVYGASLAGVFSFELVRSMNKEIKSLDSQLKVSRELILTMRSIIEEAEEMLSEQDDDIHEDFIKSAQERFDFFNVAHKVFI